MFCPYCGKEISETAGFCPYCGNRIRMAAGAPAQQGVPAQQTPAAPQAAGAGYAAPPMPPAPPAAPNGAPPPQRSRTPLVVLAVLAGVLLLAGAVAAALYFAGGGRARRAQQQFARAEAAFDTLSRELAQIEAPYLDVDGYADPADQQALLADVYRFAGEQRQKGVLTDCAYHDGDTMVYMQIDGWYGVLYGAPLRDMMAGGSDISITTLEPYAGTLDFSVTHAAANGKGADQAAEELAARMDGFHFTGNYNGDFVSVDFLENNDFANSILMWVGHGGYEADVGSVLFLGTPKMDASTWIIRQQEMADGALFRNSEGSYSVNKVFVEKYMQDGAFENSLVYLGACSSARDQLETQDGLIQAMLDKGARFVMGNSTTVSLIYNYSMLYTFFDGMLQTNSDGSAYDVADALAYARGKHGDFDSVVATGCYVWGDGENITLADLVSGGAAAAAPAPTSAPAGGTTPARPLPTATAAPTAEPGSGAPLHAADLTWLVEPRFTYDDVEPVWARSFSDNIPDPPIYSDSKDYFPGTRIAEMCYTHYSPLPQYYQAVSGGNVRLFYMPDRIDSGNLVTDGGVYVYDSSGIMFYDRSGAFWYHGFTWDSAGNTVYLDPPWNVITSAERGGGGASLFWDVDHNTPNFEWSLDGPGHILPLRQITLHKPYPIRQARTLHNSEYDDYDYSENVSDKQAYIRSDGTLITAFVYDQAETFSDGVAACMRDGHWGYIDENGREITDFVYDAPWALRGYLDWGPLAYPCTSDTMVVSKNGRMGVLYRDGSVLIEFGEFEDLAPAWNDQLWARQGGKWGLIDLAAAKQKCGLQSPAATAPGQTPAQGGSAGTAAGSSGTGSLFAGLDVQPDTVYALDQRRQCTVTAKPSLILRRGPGTEYDRLDSIPLGTVIYELGTSDSHPDWIVTEYNGQVGWVSRQYLAYP